MGGLSGMIRVGPNAITGILITGRQREPLPRGCGKRSAGRYKDAALQDQVMSPQAEGATRGWKGPGGSSPGASRKCGPAHPRILAQGYPFGFRLWKCKVGGHLTGAAQDTREVNNISHGHTAGEWPSRDPNPNPFSSKVHTFSCSPLGLLEKKRR